MKRIFVLTFCLAALAGCQSPPVRSSSGDAPKAAGTNAGNTGTGNTVEIGRSDGKEPGEGEVVAKVQRKAIKPTEKPEPIQAEPLKFDEVIQKNDRIVFVGDDITQQQFYVRSFATALLCMKPDYGLRFYNGGMNGATATSAIDWVDDLFATCKPTLVVFCFGLNDGKNLPPSDEVVEKYEAALSKLIEKAKAFKGVREVVIMSSPAVQTGEGQLGNKGGYNQTLFRLALSAQTIAAVKKVKFIDIYEPMRVVYTEAARAGGDMLSIGGRLPTEDAHTVLASVMLYAIGVTREMLEPVGWAPLKPVRMGRVRGALGIPLKEPGYKEAVQSRAVYEKMRDFDTLFFQAWRLAKPERTVRSRSELIDQADAAWFEVDTYVRGAYASGTTASP